MSKEHNKRNTNKNTSPGILYVRYDKNTICGQIVEMLKQECGYGLNKKILNLIFLSEIVERLDSKVIGSGAVNLENLSYALYESQKLFAQKLRLSETQIVNLAIQTGEQKSKESHPSFLNEYYRLEKNF